MEKKKCFCYLLESENKALRHAFIQRQTNILIRELINENDNLRKENLILAQIETIEQEKKQGTPITELGLSAYAIRCLVRRNIEFIEQLPKTKKELLRMRGVGEQTANEIIEKVKMLGFDLL